MLENDSLQFLLAVYQITGNLTGHIVIASELARKFKFDEHYTKQVIGYLLGKGYIKFKTGRFITITNAGIGAALQVSPPKDIRLDLKELKRKSERFLVKMREEALYEGTAIEDGIAVAVKSILDSFGMTWEDFKPIRNYLISENYLREFAADDLDLITHAGLKYAAKLAESQGENSAVGTQGLEATVESPSAHEQQDVNSLFDEEKTVIHVQFEVNTNSYQFQKWLSEYNEWQLPNTVSRRERTNAAIVETTTIALPEKEVMVLVVWACDKPRNGSADDLEEKFPAFRFEIYERRYEIYVKADCLVSTLRKPFLGSMLKIAKTWPRSISGMASILVDEAKKGAKKAEGAANRFSRLTLGGTPSWYFDEIQAYRDFEWGFRELLLVSAANTSPAGKNISAEASTKRRQAGDDIWKEHIPHMYWFIIDKWIEGYTGTDIALMDGVAYSPGTIQNIVSAQRKNLVEVFGKQRAIELIPYH